MKNKRFQRLNQFLGIFTLTMVLCSCSGVKPLNRECSIKRKNPYNTTEIANSQDMRDIRVEYNYYGSSVDYSSANTNYFYINNTWRQDNDDDSYFMACSIDEQYNLNLNVHTYAVTNPSIYNVSISAFVVPLDSTYESYSHGNICYLCSTNVFTLQNGLIYGFDSSKNPNQLNTTYQCRSFEDVQGPGGSTMGRDRIYDLSLNPSNSKLYVLLMLTRPINVTINENVSQDLTYNIGKLKIFMINFSNNAIYQKQDATNEQLIQDAYNDGFSNGQESGKSIGRQETIENTYQGKTYQQIYNTGYSDAETSIGGTTSLIPSLFGAIVNIPISILNGLVPLTFFDISIIRVALTFLALGVVMWIIRKVLI